MSLTQSPCRILTRSSQAIRTRVGDGSSPSSRRIASSVLLSAARPRTQGIRAIHASPRSPHPHSRSNTSHHPAALRQSTLQHTSLSTSSLRSRPHQLTKHDRPFSTTSKSHIPSPPKQTPHRQRAPHLGPPKTNDRGPASDEDTQTDFNALNVLGSAPQPSTAIEACTPDGFMLDSGLSITGSDGIVLVAGECFVYRPWMPPPAPSRIGDGSPSAAQDTGQEEERTVPATVKAKRAALMDAVGALVLPKSSLGVLELLHPKPDLLVVGTGAQIRPLSRETRRYLMEELGMRLEVLDTHNAAAQFNLLATERGVGDVGAVMIPIGF